MFDFNVVLSFSSLYIFYLSTLIIYFIFISYHDPNCCCVSLEWSTVRMSRIDSSAANVRCRANAITSVADIARPGNHCPRATYGKSLCLPPDARSTLHILDWVIILEWKISSSSYNFFFRLIGLLFSRFVCWKSVDMLSDNLTRSFFLSRGSFKFLPVVSVCVGCAIYWRSLPILLNT